MADIRSPLKFFFFTGITAAAVITLTSYLLPKKTSPAKKILPSPRETLLPKLTEQEKIRLAYPNDLLPGARDVPTPFGTIRVNEWGPETGDKVLFIHGDSTPSPIWAGVAGRLADKGFRVMCFDLYGRGYSDTPAHVLHGTELYLVQILSAITSSPISWTGNASGGFSLVGFSLGGLITLNFFQSYPNLVNSIVLLAPAGLLRNLPSSYTRYSFRHTDLVPKSYLRKLAAEALGVDLVPHKSNTEPTEGIDLQAICQWQFDHHQGHVTSFISTINSGMPQNQEHIWRAACEIIKQRAASLAVNERNRKGGRLLLFCGNEDWVVPPGDNKADFDRLLSKDCYDMKILKGGHGFVLDNSEQIAESLFEFWA